jgi:hypothetical protein
MEQRTKLAGIGCALGCGLTGALIIGFALATIIALTVVGNSLNDLFSEVATQVEDQGEQ